ncbi:hypothetical protein VT84_09335 [Gemmata sp. SH-PL17]|uniref:hypothetical protein n=1 Tax=Gemmata sp. SH-PL17 TaxID=1630693 RepID=UPI00078C28F7|nr:hypothetical protein [Gemmata sp. SH-PL17]AMV24586.1 hypothetical protein VT84_09335 [Gemmata sp. SH-PL17]
MDEQKEMTADMALQVVSETINAMLQPVLITRSHLTDENLSLLRSRARELSSAYSTLNAAVEKQQEVLAAERKRIANEMFAEADRQESKCRSQYDEGHVVAIEFREFAQKLWGRRSFPRRSPKRRRATVGGGGSIVRANLSLLRSAGQWFRANCMCGFPVSKIRSPCPR